MRFRFGLSPKKMSTPVTTSNLLWIYFLIIDRWRHSYFNLIFTIIIPSNQNTSLKAQGPFIRCDSWRQRQFISLRKLWVLWEQTNLFTWTIMSTTGFNGEVFIWSCRWRTVWMGLESNPWVMLSIDCTFPYAVLWSNLWHFLSFE